MATNEFEQVHAGRLQNIIQKTESVFARAEALGLLTFIEFIGSEAVWHNGQPDAESLELEDSGLSPDDQAELVDLHREQAELTAEVYFNSTVSDRKIDLITEITLKGMERVRLASGSREDDESLARDAEIIAAETEASCREVTAAKPSTFQYRAIRLSGTLADETEKRAIEAELIHITVPDVHPLGAISVRRLVVADSPIEKELVLDEKDGVVQAAEYEVRPLKDSVIGEIVQVIGVDDYAEVSKASVGMDETELDAKLSELWQKHQGTSTEQVIAPVLDNLRIRILSTWEAVRMKVAMGDTDKKPPVEFMDEVITLLSDI